MKKSTLALAITAGVLAQTALADGFLEDSKASVSARTFYYNNDNRDGGQSGKFNGNQNETAEGLKFNYVSGYTQGTVGFGLDVQAMMGIHLDGGSGSHPLGNSNSFSPSDGNGAADDWSTLGGNLKAKISRTELKVGNSLFPVLPILIANDSRVLPQMFEGGILTSKDIPNLALTAGELTHATGRASSDESSLSVAGGTKGSNDFKFAGGDYKPFGSSDNKAIKDLTVQYYYASLEDYYKQNFFGLTHVLPIADNQSFKTDLRYFDSSSDGKNGDSGYAFNNNNGYAKHAGEVDNQTWTSMFTYTLGGHSLMLGYQSVSDNGGFVWLNQGSLTNPAQGEGGTSLYLFTDNVSGNNFVRAGEKTKLAQYAYDFAGLGVPGLKASIAWMDGDNIKRRTGTGDDISERETDLRVDYVIPTGALKGLGFTVRQGYYRHDSDDNTGSNTDQTRVILNYTYAFM